MILPTHPDRPPVDLSRSVLVVGTPVLDRAQPLYQAGSTLLMMTWYLVSTGADVNAAWDRYQKARGGRN